MRRIPMIAAAVVLVLAACAGADPSTTSAGTEEQAQPEPTGDDSAEEYWVALSNILGEATNREQACTDAAAAQAEPDVAAILADCVIEPFGADTTRIDALTAPADVASLHASYVAARTAWFERVSDLAATTEDPAALSGDPEFVDAWNLVADVCVALEVAAGDTGFDVSLSCPDLAGTPQPQAINAFIDADGWEVTPVGAIDTGGGVEMIIVNRGDQVVRPVVARLADGEPAPLGDAADLAPGEFQTLEIDAGTYVIHDDVAGALEAGDYATLVVVSVADLQATYVEPAMEAASCDALGGLIVDLYESYMDEVAFMTPEEFLASPLSMADDLRFGAAFQRLSQLGCDDEQVRAAVQAQLCDSALPGDMAPAVILLQACGGEEPEFMIEISELVASAGEGTLAALVHLGESSGPPTSPGQPVCVGAGAFVAIQPGAAITISAEGADPVEVELRGSAYDGHLGCALWFGAELDETATRHTIAIADHPPIEVTTAELDEAGWILELWDDETSYDLYCQERIDDYEPGVCRVLEGRG